jgi:hypothetical protein
MASTVLKGVRNESKKKLASLGIYLTLPHDLILEVPDFHSPATN